MNQFLSYTGIIAGILIFIVGFGFHWIGQLISVTHREYAKSIGICETDTLPEYEVYEKALAVADVALGWIYGVVGILLIFGSQWGYILAWIPGFALLYHSISFWSWTSSQKKAGHFTSTTKNPVRMGWFAVNLIVGLLAILVAWLGSLEVL